MLCPVCLTYNMETTAEVQVAGTGYCRPHGVEAHAATQDPRQLRARSPRPSRAPFTPPVATPPAEQ